MTSTDTGPTKAGDPIPPVEPEDIKRLRMLYKHAKLTRANGIGWQQELEASFSPGTDIPAIAARNDMIEKLAAYKGLTPWQRGEDFDDAVFKIAANIPIRVFWPRDYMIEGDELFGFDPNAFVQQLVSETGIADTGKTIPTTMGEGGRMWSGGPIQGINDTPERREERQARELLWQIFRRFSPNLDLPNFNRGQESSVHIAALMFADYLLDNIELVRKLEDEFKNRNFGCADVMKELEQIARKWAL